jgi:endonuclease YncB( thermonuclease family)
MLNETDIAFFRRRIDELLRDGQLTDWQRQFLGDVGGKISRYGVRAKLSDKQFAILRRLTNTPVERPRLVVVNDVPSPTSERSVTQATTKRDNSFKAGRYPRSPLRMRNPLRPRRLFRRPSSFKLMSSMGGRAAIVLLGLLMVVGLVGNFLGPSGTVDTSQSTPSAVGSDVGVIKTSTAGNARFTVTDGDTIRLDNGTRVRLVGFNTPEKFEPQCAAEASLGNRASARLKELVAGATTTKVILVACACKPGTEGTKRCNYGRSCGMLSVDGRDVGKTLIAEGLAVPFVCGATGCPPTPRPWCG